MDFLELIMTSKEELQEGMRTVLAEYSAIKEAHQKDLEEFKAATAPGYKRVEEAYKNFDAGYESAIRHFKAVFDSLIYPEIPAETENVKDFYNAIKKITDITPTEMDTLHELRHCLEEAFITNDEKHNET